MVTPDSNEEEKAVPITRPSAKLCRLSPTSIMIANKLTVLPKEPNEGMRSINKELQTSWVPSHPSTFPIHPDILTLHLINVIVNSPIRFRIEDKPELEMKYGTQ